LKTPSTPRFALARCLGALSLVLLLPACAGERPPEQLAVSRHPIVGGEETPVCAFPTAGHFIASLGANTLANCTATLVHPRMITLAAHSDD
jgi:hypothetical protein